MVRVARGRIGSHRDPFTSALQTRSPANISHPSRCDRKSLAARLLVSYPCQSYSLGWGGDEPPHAIRNPSSEGVPKVPPWMSSTSSSWVKRIDHTIGDQIADKYRLIAFPWRETDDLGMRGIGLKFVCGRPGRFNDSQFFHHL